MPEKIQTSTELSFAERAERIYLSATDQHNKHEAFRALGEQKVRGIINAELERIDSFEQAGEENESSHFSVSPEIAKKIGAIWVFSGPGTYTQESKQDRYQGIPWTKWMDRNRLQRAAVLARHIAEVRAGKPVDRSISAPGKNREELRQLIKEYGPYIIYNGAPLENESLQHVLDDDVPNRQNPIFTPEKVKIINEPIDNTIDQIKTFRLPNDPKLVGQEVALVSHAPHLDRVLHTLMLADPLPKGTRPRLFPIATPKSGKEEYALMEIRGILYQIFSSGNSATEQAHPYVLNNLP